MLSRKEKYDVAVVGATGAVGRRMLEILEKRDFPLGSLTALASARSVGQKLSFMGGKIEVKELQEDSFKGIDIALFSAGSSISKSYAPIAVNSGCIVIDNSSEWRMVKDVPLIVPEVNPFALSEKCGIIANPNCSTIQMVVALKPLHDQYSISRVIVSTYQSVSGSGQKAIEELEKQSRNFIAEEPLQNNVYPHQIAFNCLPHIDSFLENGYTKEEMKMVDETRKILDDSTIEVSPTAVRVPVFYSHSESVTVETKLPMKANIVKDIFSRSPGICLVDNPKKNQYPLPIEASGKEEVFVGRVRGDLTRENVIHFWVVSDNLLKGAASNAVQIAELLIKRQGV
jgi:aspartate-semialdehyde dehydrogenase